MLGLKINHVIKGGLTRVSALFMVTAIEELTLIDDPKSVIALNLLYLSMKTGQKISKILHPRNPSEYDNS